MPDVDIFCPCRSGSGTRRRWRRCRSWRRCRTRVVCGYILPLQEWIRDAEAVEEVQIMEALPHSCRMWIYPALAGVDPGRGGGGGGADHGGATHDSCRCLLPWQEWIRDAEAVEEVQIMEELPHQLRREISYSINRKVFKQLSLFHDFPAREQAQIAASMTPLQACHAALKP